MVGVPGKSKGCSTCRSRKKGCDRKQPACTQCLNAGLECGGYQRQRVFLNRNQETEASASVVSYRRSHSSSPPGRRSSSPPNIVLPYSMARSAYTDKYISLFLADYLPTGRSPSTTTLLAADSLSGWINIICNLHTSSPTVQLALLSLSLSSVGRRDGDFNITTQGFMCYNLAVRELSKALHNPKKADDDSMLATTKLLSLFEILYGDRLPDVLAQSRAWLGHMGGQRALLQSRSPQDFRSGVSHELFTSGRLTQLIPAITQRQRPPLNSPAWRTVPWEFAPKRPADRLVDLLADLCDVMVDADEMRRVPAAHPAREARRADVVAACWDLDRRVREWHAGTGPLRTFHAADGSLIDPQGAEDVALAHLTVTYWLTCMLLYATLKSIGGLSSSSSSSDSSDPARRPAHADPAVYIRQMGRALPYFWRPGAGLLASHLALMPLGLCMHVFYSRDEDDDDENDDDDDGPDPEDTRILTDLIMLPPVYDSVVTFLASLQRRTAQLDLALVDGLAGIKVRAKSWIKGNPAVPPSAGTPSSTS
ncbi:hypothetical protein F4780DRAFT_384331 [Xylariomycetidae sp. FL0641]|nr:hypothetical protein F4780DRAFT_384331 [Xylariomycetidae sp. FL0641]